MVLEQLVSSCPRETICHLPLCVLSLPKALSAPRHGIIGTSYWILAWCLEGQEGEGFNNCVTENTEVMSPVKPAVDFGRGPIFPTRSGLTVKGGITPAHHLLWDHTARTHQRSAFSVFRDFCLKNTCQLSLPCTGSLGNLLEVCSKVCKLLAWQHKCEQQPNVTALCKALHSDSVKVKFLDSTQGTHGRNSTVPGV